MLRSTLRTGEETQRFARERKRNAPQGGGNATLRTGEEKSRARPDRAGEFFGDDGQIPALVFVEAADAHRKVVQPEMRIGQRDQIARFEQRKFIAELERIGVADIGGALADELRDGRRKAEV